MAHHRGAEPGNLRPVFIVKQQICVCFFLSNALWHSTARAGLGRTWMMPQSKRPRRWGRALGELLLGSWTSLGRGRGGGEEKQQQLCCHQQAALGFVHMNRRAPRGGRASPRHGAPGTAPSPAAHGARARQTLHGVRQQLPCGHLLARKGLLLVRSQSQRCVATGVHFPSSCWGLHRTDKVTFLFFI